MNTSWNSSIFVSWNNLVWITAALFTKILISYSCEFIVFIALEIISLFVKSNSIVITKDFSTVGIGAGQQSRIDSCHTAIDKAKKFQPKKLENSIAASDAFFPFADGIESLIDAGVKIIVQPGGSIRDREVINAANKANIKMVFTGVRHFSH